MYRACILPRRAWEACQAHNEDVEHYDVTVVGGGPAGAVSAEMAARNGARVLVIERSPHRPPRCTGLVSPRLLELLSVPSHLVWRELRAVRIRSPAGEVTEFRAPDPKGYVLDRAGLDRWLIERADEAGAVVRFPVTGLGVDGRVLRTTSGLARFDVLIGADGPQSAVRRWAGLPSPQQSRVGVQAMVEIPGSADEDAVEVHLGTSVAPGGFAWVVPTEEGTARVGLLTDAGQAAMKLLARFLSRFCPKNRVLRTESGVVPGVPPPRTVSDRVLLVGDAAGQVKPLTGGGVLYATIAARIAGVVASDGFDALGGYEASWRREYGREIALGLRARQALALLSDSDLDQIVSALNNPVVQERVAAEGDIDRPWSAAYKLMAHPSARLILVGVARALGGWSCLRDLISGLPARDDRA